mgnify:FL=1
MSIQRAREHLKKFGLEDKILEFQVSSATVQLAAQALCCAPERIAKTLSFQDGEGCLLVVAAGDAKIDNRKFKDEFGCKAKMLGPEDVERLTGHAIGGVCPFGVGEQVKVYLDSSLKRFETVFPACGTGNSAIELSIPQLEQCSGAKKWVDVCKGWQPEAESR